MCDFLQRVKAGGRELLAENDRTKTISKGILDINQQVPLSPGEPYTVVLKSSTRKGEQDDISVQVAVSFVPVNAAPPEARLETPEVSLEADMLRQSIDLGALTFSLEDHEVCCLCGAAAMCSCSGSVGGVDDHVRHHLGAANWENGPCSRIGRYIEVASVDRWLQKGSNRFRQWGSDRHCSPHETALHESKNAPLFDVKVSRPFCPQITLKQACIFLGTVTPDIVQTGSHS